MIIPIDNKLRIKTDSNQWMLQRSHLETDKDTKVTEIVWKSFKYYPTLQDLIDGLVELRIRSIECEGMASCMVEVKNVLRELTDALEPHIKAELV